MALALFTPDPDKRAEKEMYALPIPSILLPLDLGWHFQALGISIGINIAGSAYSPSEFDYVTSCPVILSDIFI